MAKKRTAKAGKKSSQGKASVNTHTVKKKSVLPRGRIFEGTVIKKFSTRIVLEFERPVYVRKYERYFKKKTRLHARIPEGMEVELGDYVKVQECRPLSKIIHFIIIEVLKKAKTESKSGDKK